MSELLTDPVDDGQTWARRQQDAFPEWVIRYGGGDPGRWDFGLDSLNVLTYTVFDHFATQEAIDRPDNAAFTGHYVVEPVAKTQKGRRTEEPQAHLRVVPCSRWESCRS